jgi:hypothetical protein
VGEATVVANGNDEEDASKGEESIVFSGKGMHAVKLTRSTAEYPCVKRLRERRLLSFLWNRRLYSAFDAYVYVFSLEKLRSMILFCEIGFLPARTHARTHACWFTSIDQPLQAERREAGALQLAADTGAGEAGPVG